jgi:hypothetical protein
VICGQRRLSLLAAQVAWQRNCVDLCPMEPTNQHTFHQNVSVHRLHYFAAAEAKMIPRQSCYTHEPVAIKAIDCGLPGASSVTRSVPVWVPALLLSNSTSMVQEASASRLVPVGAGSPLILKRFVSKQHHLLNFALQFRTTDMGVISVFSCVLMRNFCPSLLTS